MEVGDSRLNNYIENVEHFMKCVKYKNGIMNGNEQTIESVLESAVEIQKVLSRDEAKKIRDALAILCPGHNFSQCADLVLEKLLLHPESSARVVLHAVNKYVHAYSREQLCKLIHRLLHAKKMKGQLLSLINRVRNEDIIKILDVKTVLYLWEEMMIGNAEGFEMSVKEMCEKQTSLFLDCVQMSPKNTGHSILKVILNHLDSQSDFKLWFTLLDKNNIKATSLLCSQYSEFLDGLLKFFGKYAAKAECKEDLYWDHQSYPLSAFINILHFLLKTDSKVSIAISEFINHEICDFDNYFLFWVNVKALRTLLL